MQNKDKIEDLGIFGGLPLYSEALHVGRPNVGSREAFAAQVGGIFDRNWLSNHGPCIQEFEQKLCEYLGVKHCICMCNATIAMEIAVRALGMRGEVIVPSFTFIATAHSLQWQEITPIFCDVDPVTHCLDPEKVERMITPKTTGIIGVHIWGRPCCIEALSEIAGRRNLRLMFDAAHAFGCSHQGRMIGGFGEAEVFSFHATKFFNTFEGGAVATNDDELAKKIRLMKNFGFMGLDNVIYPGTNGKMTEICAAMGLTNLESLDQFIGINKRNYDLYREELKNVPGIKMAQYDESQSHNYQYIVLEWDSTKTGLTRDQLITILHAENIRARRYFYPGCHQMEPYRSHFPHAGLLLPETESLVGRVLSLPNGTAVQPEDIKTICELIRYSISHSKEIAAKFEERGN